MKSLFLLSFVTFLSLPAFANSVANWDKVEIDVQQVFIPANFDDNDTIEIALLGVLPDTCHSLADVQVKVKNQRIEIKAYAEKNVNFFTACPMVTVPFAEVVTIGRQDIGTYKVVYQGKQTNIETSLNVAPAPVQNRDNLFYAKVNDLDYDAASNLLELDIVVPNSCLKYTKLIDLYDGGNVISILPAMEYKASEPCEPVAKNLTVKYEIPAEIKRRPLLLHVRSMNGQSLNHVVTEHEGFRAN